MMKTCVAGLVSLGALISCSSSPKEESAPTPYYESSREVSTAATVQSVDPDARKITLKGPHGNVFTCEVDERVRNLEQVQPGDQVTVNYVEAAAIQVVKKAEHAEDDRVIDQAPPGEKPKGKIVREVSRTAEVLAVDKSKGTITLRGSDDALTTIWVRHPERLAGIKVGDLLKITYREAIAVSVQPASADVR